MSATRIPEVGELRTQAAPSCAVCSTRGESLYTDLADHVEGMAGHWRMVRCPDPSCGLLWLDPMPLEEDLVLAYRNYYTHGSRQPPRTRTLDGPWAWVKQAYLASRLGYRTPAAGLKQPLATLLAPFPTHRENLEQLVMHLPAHESGRVVDVGCGNGLTVEVLRRLGWRAEGVDFDPVAVEDATGRGLEVHLGTLEAQGYGTGAFDAVTGSHLLEHVSDPAAFLRECRRILKPGGTLVLVTPNARSLGHREFGRTWRGLEPPRHLHIFTPAALEGLVERAGFTDRRLRSSARTAAFIHGASSRIARASGVAAAAGPSASWFQLAERRALRTDPWAGEELLMIASGS
jgi:2-polyprenyl-3-methyl-5-hydroxy-6-metoxy-1,4-benzoquinol methylase